MDLCYMNIDRLRVSNYQRSMSKAYIKRLSEAIGKTGVIVPLVITEDGIVLDGQHRLEACKALGIREVPCIMVEKGKEEYIMNFNTEKGSDTRDKAEVALKIYLDKARGYNNEEDMYVKELYDYVGSIAYVTIGMAYELYKRIRGGLWFGIVNRVDTALNMEMDKAIEVRKHRAERLVTLDKMLSNLIKELEEAGIDVDAYDVMADIMREVKEVEVDRLLDAIERRISKATTEERYLAQSDKYPEE